MVRVIFDHQIRGKVWHEVFIFGNGRVPTSSVVW